MGIQTTFCASLVKTFVSELEVHESSLMHFLAVMKLSLCIKKALHFSHSQTLVTQSHPLVSHSHRNCAQLQSLSNQLQFLFSRTRSNCSLHMMHLSSES